MNSIHAIAKSIFLLFFLISIAQFSKGQTTKIVTSVLDTGVGSIRTIVGNALNGDTIRFAPGLISNGSATITLVNGEIAFSKNLVFKGVYDSKGDTLYISGNNNSRVFDVTNVTTVVMDSMAIISGYDPYGKSDGTGSAGVYFTGSNLIINNSFISGNKVYTGYGGGVYANNNLTVNNSIVYNNYAPRGGGLNAEGILTLVNCIIANNTAGNASVGGAGGGAIGGAVSMTGCTVINNTSPSGTAGGILAYGGGNVFNSTFSNNSSNVGGGLYNADNDITISGCTFNNNSAQNGDGGGFCGMAYSPTITNSTFSGNSAQLGGGIYTLESIAITNCTITGNTSTQQGGGIWSDNNITTTNCTITNNSCPTGGGVWFYGAIMTSGSIIANNTVGDIYDFNNVDFDLGPASAVRSGGYNIFTDMPDGIVSSDQTKATAQQLNLSPLQNNGGNTFTMLPQTGSIAIGKGNNTDTTSDQRGYIVPVGTVRDVGAVSSTAVECTLSYWIGTFTNTAWENPANWSCGVVPGSNTNVVINDYATVVLSSNASVKSISVSTHASFTVNSPYHLTINH